MFFAIGVADLRGQSDSLLLNNGDRVIGKIKKMTNGVLLVKTPYSENDFEIKWMEVALIQSEQRFILTYSSGVRYTSKLYWGEEPGQVFINDRGQRLGLRISNIIYFQPLEASFISRLDASISLGLNVTKSNNLVQFSTRSTLGYRTETWQLSGFYDYLGSQQTNAQRVRRTDANLQFVYILKNDRFASLTSEFLSNDQQLLDLRVTNRLGYGKYFISSNRLYLRTLIGLAYTNEKYSDQQDRNRNSMEGVISTEVNLFGIKDFDLLSNITAFPGITERGRWRINYKLDLKYDMPLDFFIKIGVTYNYDNQPVEGASDGDYVIQTSFGWQLKH